MTEEIRLSKLESFSFELDGTKLQEGVFSWSGNYVLKLYVDAEKKKVFATLYYNNINRRIAKAKEKKKKNEFQNVMNKIDEILVARDKERENKR